MERGELLAVRACLASLYLRGLERPWQPTRRRWPRVLSVLCSSAPSLGSAPRVLRAAGLSEEADALAEPGLAAMGARLVESGSVLTAACPSYPAGWRDTLGSFGPPALWLRGDVPSGPFVGIAGSREPSGPAVQFVSELVEGLLQARCSIASGGCHGVDRLAAESAIALGGAGRMVEIVPCGLRSAPRRDGIAQLSASAPGAPFSKGQAMERNALVYAFGKRAMAVEPRRGVGGTWAGAVDALRRRLAVVGVSPGTAGGEPALVALGAKQLPDARGPALQEFLAWELPVVQPGLFGASVVRESQVWSA